MALFGSNPSPDRNTQVRAQAPDGFHEIAWDSVGPHLVGKTVHVQYDSADRFEGGLVNSYGSDSSKIILSYRDGRSSSGLRGTGRGVENPQLFVKGD